MAETKNRNPLAGVSLADKAKAWKETDLTKSAKERAKGRRAAENTERVQIDVTEGVGELLDQVAAEMHTTRSAVAEYLLWQGLVYGDPDELRAAYRRLDVGTRSLPASGLPGARPGDSPRHGRPGSALGSAARRGGRRLLCRHRQGRHLRRLHVWRGGGSTRLSVITAPGCSNRSSPQ